MPQRAGRDTEIMDTDSTVMEPGGHSRRLIQSVAGYWWLSLPNDRYGRKTWVAGHGRDRRLAFPPALLPLAPATPPPAKVPYATHCRRRRRANLTKISPPPISPEMVHRSGASSQIRAARK